jgi:hypothetical protein
VRECADEIKTQMREYLLGLGRLRNVVADAYKTCVCEVCDARREADAARLAAPNADPMSLRAETTPAYAFSQMHRRAYLSGGMFHRSMQCPPTRCEDLELTNDDVERVMINDKTCAYGECGKCGVDARFFECPCEYDENVTVKVREYLPQPRTVRGVDDEGNPISTTKPVKELTEVEISGKMLLDKIRDLADEYLEHCWNCRWSNTQRLIDLHKFNDDELFIQTDFAAQIANASQDNLTCTTRQHTNLDVFIVSHSPLVAHVPKRDKDGRLLHDEDGLPETVPKRVTTNDAWKFYAEASGKGKDNDYFFHNTALANIYDFYKHARAAAGKPPLKRIILWSDGAPGQYMCRQNLVKVAGFWNTRGVELVHRFAAAGAPLFFF